MNKNSETIFSPDFLRMFLSNVLLTSGFYMIMPLLPVYAAQELAIDKGKIGLIVGIFAVSSVVARPIAGFLSDRKKRMAVYLPSLVAFALCFGLYSVAWTFLVLLFARLIHGISWGFVSTSTSTVVSDIVPAKFRGRGLGYFGLSMTLAMALGPALGAFLMDYIPFWGIFAVCFGLSAFAFIISVNVKPPYVEQNKSPMSFSTVFEKRVFGISLMQFLYGITYSGVMAYPVLHGLERGVESGLKYFFPIMALFVTIFRPYAGKVTDKYGPSWVLFFGFIFFALGNILLGVSGNDIVFLMSAGVIGMGAGLIMPTLMTMTVNVVVPSRRGAANATSLT
ncbi:MAG: MFS transporter, partial [Deferribacterales bacterium]|nr:MFS transporter [Deferribacterales bacterium]